MLADQIAQADALMLVLQVQINGESVVLTGSPHMSVLSSIVTAVGKLGPESAGSDRNPDDQRLDLRVSGLTASSSGGIQEHVDWLFRDLMLGDEVLVRIVESDQADEPVERRPIGTLEAQGRSMFEHARDTYLRLRDKYEETNDVGFG